MGETLNKFYEEGKEKVGSSFIDFFAPFLKMRFHGFSIVPLIEQRRDLEFEPAKAIFEPFGFPILDLFEQSVIESKAGIETVQKLKKTLQNPPKRILCYASKYDAKAFKNAAMELRKAGVHNIVGLFLLDKV